MHIVKIEDIGYVSGRQLKELGYPDYVIEMADRSDVASFFGRLAIMISSGFIVRYERSY